jgi:hypothetical protein
MQLYKFFDLKTPEDLLRKLEREYDGWKAAPLNVDLAWNFFVTAEHLPDWIYYQDMPISGTARPDLLDGQTPNDFTRDRARPLLRICSHLANGGKHFHLRDRNLTSVERTVRENTRWIDPRWVAPEWVGEQPALRVYLAPDEQAALGRGSADVNALWLAVRVLEFWRTRKIS